MGGWLAIIGATALADAFTMFQDDYQAAFHSYNTCLRPSIEEIQAEAVQTLEKLLPRLMETSKQCGKMEFLSIVIHSSQKEARLILQ